MKIFRFSRATFCVYLLFVIALGSALSAISIPAQAYSKPNSIVASVVDTTAVTHCQTTWILNLHTSHQHTVTIACPPGSNITVKQVPLSTALANHWQYVSLGSSFENIASPQIQTKIHTLIQNMRTKLLQNSHLQSVSPFISCGTSAEQDSSWTSSYNSSVTLKSKVLWLKYPQPNCGNIFIGSVYEGQFSGGSGANESWGSFIYSYYSVYVSCFYLNGDRGNYIKYNANIGPAAQGSNPLFVNYYNSNNCSNNQELHYTAALM